MSLCLCGRPTLPRRGSKTCGSLQCLNNNTKWHKLLWWHRNHGRKDDSTIVNLYGTLPEVDMSNTKPSMNIPEVDTSGMRDTRKASRMRI